MFVKINCLKSNKINVIDRNVELLFIILYFRYVPSLIIMLVYSNTVKYFLIVKLIKLITLRYGENCFSIFT